MVRYKDYKYYLQNQIKNGNDTLETNIDDHTCWGQACAKVT